MGDDLALLGVVIEERGVDPTIRKLDSLAESGANAERATESLARAQAELVARSQALVQAAGSVDVKSASATARIVTQAAEVRALAESMGGLTAAEENSAAAIETLNVRTREHAAAIAAVQGAQAPAASATATVAKQTAALGAATGVTSSGLNSVRSSLTSMAAAMLGTAPGVAQLTGVLGTMAVGSGVMVGVLAGVAALTAGYDYLTRKTREAKDASDAFSKSDAGFAARNRADVLERAASGARPGVSTDLVEQTKALNDATLALKGYKDQLASGDTGNIGILRFGAANQQLIQLRRALADGRITTEQFEHGLTALDQALPGFENEIRKTRELGESFDAASKGAARLAAEANNAAAEARALIAVHGQPGTSFEQGGAAAVRLAEQRQALADAQTRAGAAASRGTFGVEDVENQRQAIEQATASWKDYVVATGNAALANTSYAQALSQHNSVAVEFLRNAQAQIAANQQVARTLQLQAEVTRGTGEIDKLHALNAAYRESDVAQRTLAIAIDATNQKRQNALQYQGADLARVNALVDSTARERTQQVLLNDQLDRESRLRASRNQNAGALEAAGHARDEAGLPRADAEIQQIRDRAQEEIDAAQRARDAMRGLTAQQRADEDTMLREKIANINAVTAAQIEGVQRARQAATALSVGITVRDTEAETAGIRAMAAAELAGGRAAEAMRIQLAGEDAVRRAVNDAIARGTTLSREQAEALRGSAEELERNRVNAERLRAVFNEVSGAANQFLTDAFNKRNPFPALGERIKAQILGGISDALARPITIKIAKVLGIEIPEDKQVRAANTMKDAAATQLRAAEIMAGREPSGGPSGTATPTSASIELFRKAMGIGGAAVGGYGVGYGIGQGTNSGVLGAAGGILAGVKLGSAFGPVGAAVGGLAGAIGGFLGAADAAAEAAKRLESARKQFRLALDDFAATISGDSLQRDIDQAKATAEALRQQYTDTLRIQSLIDPKQRGEVFDTYQRIQELEDRRIAQLQQEAAAMSHYLDEDLRVRELRAKGDTAAADALEFQNKQERERDEYQRTHDMSKQENRDQFAYLVYVQSLEKNSDALNENTSALISMRGTPTGFKLEPYLQEFGTGRPYPGQFQMPPTPFLPPLSPLTPPTLARTGNAATLAGAQGSYIDLRGSTFQFPNVVDGDKAADAFLKKLDRTKENTVGMNGTRAAALERMTLS